MDAPLPAARFSVEVDGRPVEVSAVSGLAFTTGETPATVVLRRAAGPDRALLDWALRPETRTVTVSLPGQRERGSVTYVLEGARPSCWRGPELDALSTEVAMEELVLSVDRIDLA